MLRSTKKFNFSLGRCLLVVWARHRAQTEGVSQATEAAHSAGQPGC